MRRAIPAVVGVVSVIVVGLVQGHWTGRWGVGEKVERAVASLARVPTEIGDWSSEELKSSGGERLDLAGQLNRRYVNRKTGDAIAVALVCDRAGPAAIHTPDVCYAASGYKVSKRMEHTLKGLGDGDNAPRFYSADMTKVTGADQTQQRLFWTWRSQGRWQVAEYPRKRFAGQPVLFKFYVARELTAPVPVDQDPCIDFLRQLLPELDRALDDGSV